MNAGLIRQLRHLQKWESGTIRILGLIELLLAASLAVTSVYAFAVNESVGLFIYMCPVLGGLGLFQVLFFSSKENMTPSLGVLLLAEIWIISFVVSAIPFMLYGFEPIDAFFEAISGYTTTGATIVDDLSLLPKSLLLWRAIIQWTGGITVLISFSFLIPMIGMGGAGLNANGMSGTDTDNYSLKITSASMNFIKVYVLLTAVEIICLLVCSVNLFDSVCITLSNIPTGGLLPRSDSMASYSTCAQFVTLVFMVLGSCNFYLMFRLFFKRDRSLLRSKETRSMLDWFAICTIIVFVSLVMNTEYGSDMSYWGEYAWSSVYSVVSCGTGTGFAIEGYEGLPTLTFLVLFIAELIGGASGSTAGGIKIYRLMAAKSYVMGNISRVMHPNAVMSIRADGRNMSEEAVSSALSTILLFIIGLFVSLGIFMLIEPQFDVQTDFGVILAALTNAGIGPMGSYSSLAFASKVLMCFLMWLGRMEMVLILIIFTKSFWSDVRLSMGEIRTAHKHEYLKKRQ